MRYRRRTCECEETVPDIVVFPRHFDMTGGGVVNHYPRPSSYYRWTGFAYLVTRISTRRFMARPSAVVFGSTGLVSA